MFVSCLLFFRLIHQRSIKTLKTDYRLFPEEWNKAHRHLNFPKDDSDRLETLLKLEDSLRCDFSRLEEIVRQKEGKGVYRIGDVAEEYRVSGDSSFLHSFTQKLIKKLNENDQVRTARAYQTAVKGLLVFCK